MHLPRENSLELFAENLQVVDADEWIALSDADILELLPGWVRRAASPVRDAVVASSRRFWLRVQGRIGLTLGALQTPRNAAGYRLDEHGAMRYRPRSNEGDAEYRERLLVRPARITPNAIRGVVNDLVRPHTPIAPLVFEPATEGLFVQAEGQYAWTCFVQPEDGPPLFAEMPDNLIPAGIWLTAEADVTRPVFVVIIEGPLYDLPDEWTVLSEGATSPPVEGDFIGADSPVAAWGYVGTETPPLEDVVLREVESRRGGGVVWWLVVLPNLGGAL